MCEDKLFSITSRSRSPLCPPRAHFYHAEKACHDAVELQTMGYMVCDSSCSWTVPNALPDDQAPHRAHTMRKEELQTVYCEAQSATPPPTMTSCAARLQRAMQDVWSGMKHCDRSLRSPALILRYTVGPQIFKWDFYLNTHQ